MLIEFANKLKRAGAMMIMAAACAGGSPANAALYTGDWDPAFGAAFPDLGWRGQATFFVPDACLPNNGLVWNFNGCSNFGMKLLSAEVDFYKVSDPNNTAFHETLFFDVPSSAVAAMTLNNGLLTGVYGTFAYSRSSLLPLAGGPYSEFVLFFQGDIARLAYEYDPPGYHNTSYGVSDKQASDGSRPFITFQVLTVPEPGSLVLIALALGMLAALTRRRAPSIAA